jgi:hypothetical protein
MTIQGKNSKVTTNTSTPSVQRRDWFGIQIVDRQTGRGVPLVELKTVNHRVFVTDSNGWVALNEPGWEGTSIYVHISSHGYTYPTDGFGNAGTAVPVTPGGRVKVELDRANVAERLYRLTGEGIYRDSVLLGESVPLAKPVMNARVFGQDTVFATPYQGKIFWLWGDTNRSDYPLGNFRTSSATSLPPGHGGLDPDLGVDYTYFTQANGFTKKMCPFEGIPGGLVWLGGLTTVVDDTDRERLIAEYTTLEGLGKPCTQGICVFNDAKEVFDPILPQEKGEWRHPGGHPLRMQDGKTEYILFASAGPFPTVRVPATYKAVCTPDAYETFTCLADGAPYADADTRLSRGADGKLAWRWTNQGAPLSQKHEKDLIKAGLMRPEECRFRLEDADTGDLIQMHNGSCFWNEYLQSYVLICGQRFGRSFLGELWFAASPSPTGPWRKAVRIITHNDYTFYNPTQHPFMDQAGGRHIYLEGTYVNTFTKNPIKTPRYDYNQIMYRLDLADPRLKPVLE